MKCFIVTVVCSVAALAVPHRHGFVGLEGMGGPNVHAGFIDKNEGGRKHDNIGANGLNNQMFSNNGAGSFYNHHEHHSHHYNYTQAEEFSSHEIVGNASENGSANKIDQNNDNTDASDAGNIVFQGETEERQQMNLK